ncbi:MAG: Alternative ribosome-rescue factor [Moraxellaceae bacterium]|jgi:stalled ribosome alternative rescue factor ArfA|nr:Alternative ribosome-rescue factor [Moraxellaceae bacterium]
MKNRRKTASAKALVFSPLFRQRQETAKKGKGSYNRRPRNQPTDSGPSCFRTPGAPRPLAAVV